MGVDFIAVLSHKFEAEELRGLPRLLSAACAPRLAEAIIALKTCEAEHYSKRDWRLPTLDDFTEEAWYVQPTRLALYRDVAGNLTSKMPPPIPSSGARIESLRKRHPGVVRMHTPPIAAWRPLTVEENWRAGYCFEVSGHAGPFLSIGPRALGLYGWPRWRTFLAVPAIQDAMRRVCREFARILGSPQALYLPDTWDPDGAILHGKTIEEIVAEIRLEHGPPELSLTVFPDDAMLGAVGAVYYLDDFAGL